MERAGKLIGTSRLSGKLLDDEDLVRAAWPQTVGKRLCGRCPVVGLIGDRLVVEVEDIVWRSQLMTLRGQILGRLEKVIGRPAATSIEFRIGGVPRRAATRETSVRAGNDEADAIPDAVMRRLYKAARKKATA